MMMMMKKKKLKKEKETANIRTVCKIARNGTTFAGRGDTAKDGMKFDVADLGPTGGDALATVKICTPVGVLSVRGDSIHTGLGRWIRGGDEFDKDDGLFEANFFCGEAITFLDMPCES